MMQSTMARAQLTVVAGFGLLAGCSEGTGPNPHSRDVGILQLQSTIAESVANPDSTVDWDV
jgi:hypothetical protein